MLFISELVFLWPLWSLMLFSTTKEPFNKDFSFFFFSPKSWDLKSFMSVVVRKGNNFLVTCYVLTNGPKANQNPSITWCSDLRATATQINFHTFQEKSHGLHTRLSTVNHRRPFSDFYWGEVLGGGVCKLSSAQSILNSDKVNLTFTALSHLEVMKLSVSGILSNNVFL